MSHRQRNIKKKIRLALTPEVIATYPSECRVEQDETGIRILRQNFTAESEYVRELRRQLREKQHTQRCRGPRESGS